MFLDALTYPFRKSGWLMIVLGAIFSVVLDFLMRAPLVGLLVALFSGGYFGAFYLDIVSTTMGGREHVPEWPDFSSLWDDIVIPFFRLTFLVLISFAPLFAAASLLDDSATSYKIAVIGAVVFGCCYFPMAVLATQAFGGIGAALPHVVLPAIVKALPGYLLALGALILVFVICALAQVYVEEVPFIGWFVSSAVALYGIIFQGRLIGLIYVQKQDRLGWD